jgi:hypothetical protein
VSRFGNIVGRVRSTRNGERREVFEADVHDAPARMFLPRNSDINEEDSIEWTTPAGELSSLRVTKVHFREAPWSNGLLDHTEVHPHAEL